ncbi:MAG: chloride channel protein [Gammaproteobacteria bacterium]
MRRHIRHSRKRLLSQLAWKIRLVFWFGSIAVGLTAVAFAGLSVHVDTLFRELKSHFPYMIYFLPPVGLLLIAWLTRRFFKGAEGSGIPQVIVTIQRKEQRFLRRSLLSLGVAFGKIILTLLGLLAGASIGREGPTVHIGASIMYFIGKLATFPPHYMEKGLILAGGSAGIAAAFNTPLAGIVFAIEELSRSFEERTSGIILTAVLFAGMTAMALQGNYNYFGSVYAIMPLDQSWLAVPLCGVIGGLLGGLFSQILVKGGRFLVPVIKTHPFVVAGVCGVLISVVGLLSGGLTFGTGYLEAQQIVTGKADYVPWFPFLKMIASVASYLSGIPGGIFSPSLAAGAGLGATLFHWFQTAPYEAMILLGMVGYFAGVIQSPITAFVIVMEMTDNHDIMLALMATSIIAYGASRLVCTSPVYQAMALQFLGAQKRLAGEEIQSKAAEPA